ncbi:MAG: flagellar assembly peptidoglycan hydrolase FlgJ [Gammaproteobacteria bacterium]
MTPELANSRVYTDFSGLAKLRASAKAESPEAVKAVAKEFEASFVEMMLKSLRDATSGEGLMDNEGSRMYQDMFDKQIAVDISERGDFGVAKVIEAQLTKPNSDVEKLKNQMPTIEKGVNGFGPSAQTLFNHTGLFNHQLDSSIKEKVNNNLEQYLQRRRMTVRPIIDLKNQSQNETIYDQVKRSDSINRTSSVERTKFKSPEEFIHTMRPHAERAAKAIGVNPDLLVAQAALETGWGKKMIKNKDGSNSHNLFGIKSGSSWEGKSVNVKSLEYRNGVAKREASDFRTYNSFEESFKDYVDFIKNQPRYDNAVNRAGNSKAYIRALQNSGYATDPQYANKVINIMKRESFQLAGNN